MRIRNYLGSIAIALAFAGSPPPLAHAEFAGACTDTDKNFSSGELNRLNRLLKNQRDEIAANALASSCGLSSAEEMAQVNQLMDTAKDWVEKCNYKEARAAFTQADRLLGKILARTAESKQKKRIFADLHSRRQKVIQDTLALKSKGAGTTAEFSRLNDLQNLLGDAQSACALEKADLLLDQMETLIRDIRKRK